VFEVKKPFSKQKPAAWKCLCGYTIPKEGAHLSGDPHYSKGYHVHCPRCLRTVVQYVDSKETQMGMQRV